MIPGPVLHHIEENQERYVGELIELLRIPSISALPDHAEDVRRAAKWLLGQARKLGFTGRLYKARGHPIVYAERCPYEDAPTLLIYSHYDVQPPGPIEKWRTPPFSPSIVNGAIYARGAVDNKGQLFTFIKAAESIIAVEGKLPLNVKLLFEGEEEIGSAGTVSFVWEHSDMLKSDVVAVIDILKYNRDLPAIYYSVKGMIVLRVDAYGPRFDVHSGLYGGAVANPVHALAQVLSSLKDDKGRIRIQGFYNHVRDIRPWEKKEMASLPFDEARMKSYLGVEALTSEEGYTALECMCARPTLDTNGIQGGASAQGYRAIIPESASALISMRLVPDQDCETVHRLFQAHMRSIKLPGIRIKATRIISAEPILVSRESGAVKAAEKAIAYAFGIRPALVRIGGTSAIVDPLVKALGIDNILLTGWGDPSQGEHSCNEYFRLDDFHRGTVAAAALMYELAKKEKRTLSRIEKIF